MHIRNEARLKGIKKGSVNVDDYIDGIASIHFANVEKRIKVGRLLDKANKKYSGDSSFSILNGYVSKPIEKSFSTNFG